MRVDPGGHGDEETIFFLCARDDAFARGKAVIGVENGVVVLRGAGFDGGREFAGHEYAGTGHRIPKILRWMSGLADGVQFQKPRFCMRKGRPGLTMNCCKYLSALLFSLLVSGSALAALVFLLHRAVYDLSLGRVEQVRVASGPVGRTVVVWEGGRTQRVHT